MKKNGMFCQKNWYFLYFWSSFPIFPIFGNKIVLKVVFSETFRKNVILHLSHSLQKEYSCDCDCHSSSYNKIKKHLLVATFLLNFGAYMDISYIIKEMIFVCSANGHIGPPQLYWTLNLEWLLCIEHVF